MKKITKNKFVVTGGAGFVGSNLRGTFKNKEY